MAKFETNRYATPKMTVVCCVEDELVQKDLEPFGQYDVQYVEWTPENAFKLFQQLADLFTERGP